MGASSPIISGCGIKRLESTNQSIDLGYQLLLTLDSKSLCSPLKKSDLFLSLLIKHCHACLVAFLDKCPDLHIILFELCLYQLKVLIEAIP